jgi:hypothetical protein
MTNTENESEKYQNSDMSSDKKNGDISSIESRSDKYSLDTTRSMKDRFGFLLVDTFHQKLSVSEKISKARKDKESERARKWIKMSKNWAFFTKYRSRKLKERVRKGIPDAFRSFAWYELAECNAIKAKYSNPYELETARISAQTRDEVLKI